MPLLSIRIEHGGNLLGKGFVYLSKPLRDILMHRGF